MFLTKLRRIIVAGYKNFTRNPFPSIASVLIMTITLSVLTSLILVQATLNSTLNNIKEKVDITVYFIPKAPEEVILEIQDSVRSLPEVSGVTYISQEKALVDFKERHSNDYLTLQALEEIGENPLGAALNINAIDPSHYEIISNYFEDGTTLSRGALSVIDKIDYRQNKLVIDRLSSIIEGARRFGIIASLVLVIISILITFSTIRLIIYMSREEIGVMKLVGAGERHISGPFIASGVMVGIMASIVTALIFIPISIWLGNQMTDFFGINIYTYYKANFWQLFTIMLGSGIVLGGISSVFAINKYLRKR